MIERRLVQIGCGQLSGVVAALQTSGLPLDDLCGATAIYRLEDDEGPIGWAALEAREGAALLRSVVIVEGRRGAGAGAELIKGVIERAADDGYGEVWLRTKTATPFFARLGLAAVERGSAQAAIGKTSELSSLCPASANCMKMELPAG